MLPIPFSSLRCALAVLFTLFAVLLVCTPAAPAAPAADCTAVLPAIVPAFDITDVVHDRSRLVQCSVIAVALGIALLWWGQKT